MSIQAKNAQNLYLHAIQNVTLRLFVPLKMEIWCLFMCTNTLMEGKPNG